MHYGNIGIEGRLDFTVTGRAVNTVARLERLSKSLGKAVVTSGRFAELVPDEVEALGSHELRGRATLIDVYTLKELA